MSQEIDDQCVECIRLIQDQDETGLELLMSLLRKRLLRFFCQRSVSEDIAEDLAQEVFIKIWQRADQFSHGRAVMPWVISIARNRLIDWVRSEKRHNRCEVLSQMKFHDASGATFTGDACMDAVVDQSSLEDHQIDDVREVAADVLAPAYLRTIEARLCGDTIDMIAAKEGVASQTIRWRLSQAVEVLKNSRQFSSSFTGAIV